MNIDDLFGKRAGERRKLTDDEVTELLDAPPIPPPLLSDYDEYPTRRLPSIAAAPPPNVERLKEIAQALAKQHPWRWNGLMHDIAWLRKRAARYGVREDEVRWLI